MGQVGTLYIVATPIGNLDDISQRALNILQEVDVVAAEDTRHSRKLLEAHHISTPMISVHEHNEAARSGALLERIESGESVALISDAGTPLISDPGYVLVKEARVRGVKVVPIPGASAVVTALSAAGLPTDRFLFAGFLPQKASARQQQLEHLLSQEATVVLYESPRRIVSLLALVGELDERRELCLAKELTKTFERFMTGEPNQLIALLEESPELQKGEWVVMIAPAEKKQETELSTDVLRAVELAAEELPLKKACEVVAKITGHKKNKLYQAVLANRE